jgi:tripartite-type tricarboxylate transporter receptor subunit TctC
MKTLIRIGLLTAAAVLGGATASQAQLYAGKTATMVINYGAGGTIDVEGRIFQRHLPKHLDGRPTIIAQNMPGAGGLTAVNALGKGVIGKPDGLTFGFFAFSPIAMVIGDPALQVNVADFAAIGGIGAWYVAYGRKDMLPGAQRPADMAKVTQNIFAGGYSPTSVHDVRMRLMLDLMGLKYKIIRGFQDVAAVNKAMLQNEVNFTAISLPGYESNTVPQVIDTGVALPLWQFPTSGPNGTFLDKPGLTARGIQSYEQVYREAFGKMPSGPQFDAFILLNDVSAKLGRVLLMPPRTPPAAVAEMRKAYAALANDQEFKSEYLRAVKVEADLAMPEDAVAVLAKLKAVEPAVVTVIEKAATAE